MPKRKPSAADQFIVATLDTRHFRFQSYGRTKQEALDILRKTWTKHCEQYRNEENLWYFDQCVKEEGVEYETVQLGIGTRDREILVEA